MSKHTPGPWCIAKGTHQIFIQCKAPVGPYDVATITTLEEDGEQSKIETQANARLIAAAPEMFDALRELTIAAEAAGWDIGDNASVLNAARAAIAKAEGGAP